MLTPAATLVLAMPAAPAKEHWKPTAESVGNAIANGMDHKWRRVYSSHRASSRERLTAPGRCALVSDALALSTFVSRLADRASMIRFGEA